MEMIIALVIHNVDQIDAGHQLFREKLHGRANRPPLKNLSTD